LPISVGILSIDDGRVESELISLDAGAGHG
jgi:hypothetical protein